jgi:hypothetical protein
MNTAKFGLGQIHNPTPQFATWLFRYVLYGATVLNIICQVISEIPEPVKAMIGKYSIEAVTLCHILSKMFGVPLPADSSVPVEDVASLKTDNPQVK